jgi:glycosyltransferase involved in cell wall biosynthesis
MMKEKISVLIPAYNRENFIKACIDSVLAQTYPDIQVIVYDDGSTDDTVNIVRTYPNVRLIEGKENRGVSYARNRLLEACDTKYAAWQDSDDVAAPTRIEEQHIRIKNTEAALVYCYCVFMSRKGSVRPDDNIRCMGGTMFDMEKIKGIYFNEDIKLGAEDNLWLACIGKRHGEPALVPAQLYYIRTHPDRISNWKRLPGNRLAREQSDKVYSEELKKLNGQ